MSDVHVGQEESQEFDAEVFAHCTHFDQAVQLCDNQRFDGKHKRSFRLPRDEIVPWLKEGKYLWAGIMPTKALPAAIDIPSSQLIPQAGGNSRYGPIVVSMTIEEALAMYSSTYGHYEIIVLPCEVRSPALT